MQWHFGPFRLDLPNACLWRAGQLVPLRPKTFAILAHLVQHVGQLVTKEALLDAVWPEMAVSDGVLKTGMNELRKALGETAKAPQWIATVRGRGYRFVAPVTPVVPTPAPPEGELPFPLSTAMAEVSPPPPLRLQQDIMPRPEILVERETVLERLHTALVQARQGVRQVVFVTGEAGIGKTAVVEAFAVQAAAPLRVARGQCVEHYGTGEAYLPVLEAFSQLCRGPEGTHLVALLRQQAPTWLVQMPWLLGTTDRQRLQYELQGATRERMLRELTEVMDTLTAETPLLLLLEDLHWSDYATLDLVAMLARRRTPARLLLVGTYRPVEVIVQGHPLRAVTLDLQRQGHSTELPLSELSVEAVAAYLTARFPDHQFPETLVWWLHQHTDGNPLFQVTLTAALVARGVLAERSGRWTLVGTLEAVEGEVPEGLRPLLEQQLERLPVEAQQVVEVASVAGVTFSAAAVAAGLEAAVPQIEMQCDALVRWQLLRPGGLETWPDGTVAACYTFTHALYQQAAYERIGSGRRAQLHQRLGTRLEAAYGSHVRDIAAALAEHFGRGQDARRAVLYLHQAAENAAQRYAPHEVTALLTRALALLKGLPETPERIRQELDLQIAMGPALMATKGPAAPEAEQAYARARALCAQVGDTLQLLPTLRGLCRFYINRGALQTAQELGEQLYRLAQHAAAPTPRLEAHGALGATLFYLGDYAAARTHLEQGIALTDPAAQRPLALRHDVAPGVAFLALAASTLWCLGFPAQAVQRSQEALALAQTLAHPQSLAMARHFAAYLHHRRREVPACLAQADTLLSLATAQGFPLWVGFGTCWRGWVLAVQGQDEAGLVQLRQGLAAVLATGQTLSRPLCLVLLAEAAGHVGQVAEGLRLLAEALAAFEASGRGDLLSEAYRLQGALLLRQTVPDATRAEACFQQALAIARRQQAKSWELRAAMSLSRLWQQQGKRADARQLLAEVYGWFSEGFDTADLQEARALLEALM
jgi:DNA-binding winged helix-turn-helix (wHTH) protein/predicted ATPase